MHNITGRCPHCDGTGDVHRADGEWLGVCDCSAGTPTPEAPQTTARTLTVEHLDRLEAFVRVTLGSRTFPTLHGIEAWEWMALLAAARKGLTHGA